MSWFSLVERTLDVLGVSVGDLQLADATELAARRYPNLSTDRSALVGSLANPALCRQLSIRLRQAYPEDHSVALVSAVDGDRPTVQWVALEELDRVPVRGIALLYLPPLTCPGALETFQATVAHLRAPDGCPWDREQTHRSLRQGLLEEAYEVLDALDRGDLELLKEELGDVLLHIVLQAQIAAERGEFRMADVLCHVNRKIVYRHPHVFDGLVVDGVEQVLTNWEELKRQEKGGRQPDASPFEGIPVSMPALARTQAVLRRAKRLEGLQAGKDAVERIPELATLLAAAPESEDRAGLLGRLLFALARLGSQMGVDAESALREANARFEQAVRRELGTLPGVSASEN